MEDKIFSRKLQAARQLSKISAYSVPHAEYVAAFRSLYFGATKEQRVDLKSLVYGIEGMTAVILSYCYDAGMRDARRFRKNR
jgi:hypothetical protein